MCQPTRRKKNNYRYFFFEIHSEQESLLKNIHMHMHTPEQQLHDSVEEPPSIRRNRRAISHQLSTELQDLVQELAERRAEEIAQERAEEITQQALRELAHEREQRQEREYEIELLRELRQIERQLMSSNTPAITREQLCRRHEQLCALLNISDTN